MDLGRVGIWTFHLDQFPWTQGPEIVQELEALGYGSIWLPEAVNRDPLVSATLVLGATQRMSRRHRNRVDLRVWDRWR